MFYIWSQVGSAVRGSRYTSPSRRFATGESGRIALVQVMREEGESPDVTRWTQAPGTDVQPCPLAPGHVEAAMNSAYTPWNTTEDVFDDIAWEDAKAYVEANFVERSYVSGMYERLYEESATETGLLAEVES
jgi:hypothetical protein